MLSIQILEADDIVTDECWFRPLHLMCNPWSDYVDTGDTRPLNNVQWALTGIFAPGLIGQSVRTINEPKSYYTLHYEFALGHIPGHHLDYRNFSPLRRMAIGKYKNIFASQVECKDPSYFRWYDSKVRKYQCVPHSTLASELLKLHAELEKVTQSAF